MPVSLCLTMCSHFTLPLRYLVRILHLHTFIARGCHSASLALKAGGEEVNNRTAGIPAAICSIFGKCSYYTWRGIQLLFQGILKGIGFTIRQTLGSPSDLAAYVLIIFLFAGLAAFIAFFSYQCFSEASIAFDDTRYGVHAQIQSLEESNVTTSWQKWALSSIGSVESYFMQGLEWVNETWPEGSQMVNSAWEALKAYNATIHGVDDASSIVLTTGSAALVNASFAGAVATIPPMSLANASSLQAEHSASSDSDLHTAFGPSPSPDDFDVRLDTRGRVLGGAGGGQEEEREKTEDVFLSQEDRDDGTRKRHSAHSPYSGSGTSQRSSNKQASSSPIPTSTSPPPSLTAVSSTPSTSRSSTTTVDSAHLLGREEGDGEKVNETEEVEEVKSPGSFWSNWISTLAGVFGFSGEEEEHEAPEEIGGGVDSNGEPVSQPSRPSKVKTSISKQEMDKGKSEREADQPHVHDAAAEAIRAQGDNITIAQCHGLWINEEGTKDVVGRASLSEAVDLLQSNHSLPGRITLVTSIIFRNTSVALDSDCRREALAAVAGVSMVRDPCDAWR